MVDSRYIEVELVVMVMVVMMVVMMVIVVVMVIVVMMVMEEGGGDMFHGNMAQQNRARRCRTGVCTARGVQHGGAH